MLAVVEHEQEARVADLAHERGDRVLLGAQVEPDRGGGLAGDQCRVADRGQLDEPRALRVVPRGELQREPRLAAAAGAGEREQPGVAQQPSELRQLALAPDEARQLARQAARGR